LADGDPRAKQSLERLDDRTESECAFRKYTLDVCCDRRIASSWMATASAPVSHWFAMKTAASSMRAPASSMASTRADRSPVRASASHSSRMAFTSARLLPKAQ